MQLRSGMIVALILLASSMIWAEQWTTLGPEGGDARSLAYDPQNPNHIFLGTSTGTLFLSTDRGHSWSCFAHLGADDYVLDHIVIDPHNSGYIYVGAWSLAKRHAGELFRSRDGGKSWQTIPAMRGKSIRTMAIAASDPRILVVGALDGVFRSKDGGHRWKKISASHPNIKNIESITIDPGDPQVVYAGTRHLAWKTANAGASWHLMDRGMIDDSDVFSILVDESNSQVVFTSACSGIYKSEDGGGFFDRVQNIPFSARRTRVLKQDPQNPAVIYAGTTEGLWVTSNSGKTWTRVTSPEIVINDILVDPRKTWRVLLATDRAGVLASDDHLSFVASNYGFAHRYISSILTDRDGPDIYVGVVNDRDCGGVFVSNDAGWHWSQISEGLGGKDVFALKRADDGAIIAGTDHGLFLLRHHAKEWTPIGQINEANPGEKRDSKRSSALTVKVNDIALGRENWVAATSAGVYVSFNKGENWSRISGLGKGYFVSVQARDNLIVITTPRRILTSTDRGKRWRASRVMPSYVSGLRTLAITPDRQIIVASHGGAFRTRNLGARWDRLYLGLPKRNINFVAYDESSHRLLATSTHSTLIFESENGGTSWNRGPDTKYPLRQLGAAGGRIVAVTDFDGVMVQTEKATDTYPEVGATSSNR